MIESGKEAEAISHSTEITLIAMVLAGIIIGIVDSNIRYQKHHQAN
jgi:hypothetical protein